MNCEACPAKPPRPGIGRFTWGSFEDPVLDKIVDNKPVYSYVPRREPMNEAILCQECSDKLWTAIHGAVNVGHMYFKAARL